MYDNSVPKYFQMDPETDDLFVDGELLKNGMQVLIANNYFRVGQEQALLSDNVEDYEKYLHMNFWCSISQLKIEDRTVRFVGIYENNVKRYRSHDIGEPWYIKKDSLPPQQEFLIVPDGVQVLQYPIVDSKENQQ